MLIQVLIICAWLVYLIGVVLLLLALERFRSRRTLLRLLLCTAALTASGAMLGVASNSDVPKDYADTFLTRVLDSAAGGLYYTLIVTALAVLVVAALRGLPAFRTTR